MSDLTRVLDTINQGRVALDLPALAALSKAVPGDPCNCVVAEAFPRSSVNTSRITNVDLIRADGAKRLAAAWGTEAHSVFTVELPEILKDFVVAFDEGVYPQLISSDLQRADFEIEVIRENVVLWTHKRLEMTSKLFATVKEAHADLNRLLAGEQRI